jgi:TolB protein
MSVARKGERFTTEEFGDIELPDEVHVGLFICAHNPDVVETGRFSNVRITVPAPADFQPYQDYYASRLEIMDVDTGHRTVVHTQPDSMQAPNWTHDGKALIYNRNGLLYRFDIASGEAERIDTGFATQNNNDHVISFDGRRLGISHHSADHGGDSMIYTLPLTGGVPELVTRRGPSYFHGWSPDGEWLTFTGGRDGEWDIYKIRSDGSEDEIRLTDDPALDDGSEYSPDGEFIYFNSARTGRMEIWRMRPDGAAQEQVTDDEYNNWFPHVSPDGKRIVYLAYPPDIEPADHPWYKHVYLMLMPAAGGEARVIANLYGGQGTINVPSWSPDGTRIAFVSNTVELE